MIRLKTDKDIAILREGGAILRGILRQVAAKIEPGVTTAQLDRFAEQSIIKAGGQPAFKNYQSVPSDPPFPCTLCTSVNHQVVHGIASPNVILQQGDIVSIDVGMRYRGLFTDTAMTVPVGSISPHIQKLLDVTEESLRRGIAAAQPGGMLSDIGRAVQQYVEGEKFSVVKDLVGHGVGYAVHEDPRVPNFVDEGFNIRLEPGLVIAIEPMVNMGTDGVKVMNDGWTIVTADGALSAHFEHTVAVTADGPLIITE